MYVYMHTIYTIRGKEVINLKGSRIREELILEELEGEKESGK